MSGGFWMVLRQIAPADSDPWAVGFFNNDRKLGITHLSWYGNEDAARAAHHRLEHGS